MKAENLNVYIFKGLNILNLNKIITLYYYFAPVKTLHSVICWQDDEKNEKKKRESEAYQSKKEHLQINNYKFLYKYWQKFG